MGEYSVRSFLKENPEALQRVFCGGGKAAVKSVEKEESAGRFWRLRGV